MRRHVTVLLVWATVLSSPIATLSADKVEAIESERGKEVWFGHMCAYCHKALPNTGGTVARFRTIHSVAGRDWVDKSVESRLLSVYAGLPDDDIAQVSAWIQAVQDSRNQHQKKYDKLR